MAHDSFTLTGTYQLFDGTPARGIVEIIPSEKMVKDTTGNIVLSGRVKVELDASGALSVVLPDPRDTVNLNPAGFGYTVVAKLYHQHLAAVSFGGDQITAAIVAGAVDIEDVMSVDPSTFVASATYVDSSTYTAGLAGKADASALSDEIARATAAEGTKVNSSTYTAGLATKQDAATLDTSVAGYVNDSASSTRAALGVAYARKQAKVADLARPFVLAHRGGGGLLAPENTMYAFKVGAALGHPAVDGGDWWTTMDGGLVCCHDTTLDRTTTLTGSPASVSTMKAQQAVVDCSSWFGGGFSNTVPISVEEMLGTFGGNVVLFPEPKDAAAATTLADIIERMGLQESVMPNAFHQEWLQPFIDAGCSDVCLSAGAFPSPSALASYAPAGIKWLGLDYTWATAQNVADAKAAGLEVVIYTPNRKANVAALLGSEVSGWVSDDPVYFAHALDATNASKYRRSSDPFAQASYYHGHQANQSDGTTNPNDRGTFANGRWYPGFSNGGACSVLQGWACPLPNPSAYTITFNLACDTMGTDSTRWGGIAFGCPDDAVWKDVHASTETGYQFYLRRFGQLNLFRRDAGTDQGSVVQGSSAGYLNPLILTAGLAVGTAVTALPVQALPAAVPVGAVFALPTGQYATVSTAAASGATSVAVSSITPSAAVASGASLPQAATLRVDVTSASVTVTRTDVSPNVSVTMNDTAHRGAYFHFLQNAASSGYQTSFGNVSIT